MSLFAAAHCVAVTGLDCSLQERAAFARVRSNAHWHVVRRQQLGVWVRCLAPAVVVQHLQSSPDADIVCWDVLI
jgi:hypothetical protein